MKNHTIILPNLTAAGLALILSGCASDPAPIDQAPILSGEQMLSESQRLASLGDRWKKGKELVNRGTALVREGQNKIDESIRMIEEGQQIQNESKSTVQATTTPLISGEQMLSESQRLASLGDRWKKGKDLVDRGNILAREGQNNIDEGNRLTQEGVQIQHESEESSRTLKK